MSNVKTDLFQADSNTVNAIKIRKDRVHRSHLRQSPSTTGSADRFRQFQNRFLGGKIPFQSELCGFAISLVCFDAIATKDDLVAAISSRSSPYAFNDNVCVDWSYSSGRINRRYLSLFTVNAMAAANNSTLPIKELLEQIDAALATCCPPTSSRLDALLNDARAWLTQVLPGPLWAHCLGTNLLTGLPKTTLARKSSGTAIQDGDKNQEQETAVALGIALDGYLAAHKKDVGSAVAYKIKSVCQINKKLSNSADKQRMLKGCLALASEAHATGPITSLLLAWVIDLIESGSPKLETVSPATIQKYVGNALVSLYQYFRGIEIESLTSENYSDIYQVIIDSAISSQKQTTSSALSSWHFFLETWLEAAPLTKRLYDGIELSIPRANVIWPHEIQSMFQWLDCATADERLIQQMKVALTIATNCRIRISELLKLRLRNIQCLQDGVQIDVSPLRRDGELKSTSSRRTMQIEDIDSASVISGWIDRRKSEGAYSVDLLFGDPHRPNSGYRLGQLYVSINQLLKSTTGDRTASFHTLSHTWISTEFERALVSKAVADINPLDPLSAAAGHTSAQTSLIHYFHFFERPLRYYLGNV